MVVNKIIYWVWRWLRKHMSGIIVTMVGVFAAFWFTGLGEQSALDRTTRQKLHLVVLEAKYNSRITKQFLHDYAEAADPNVIRINVKRPNTIAATAAFRDANILALVPLHKVSLLRGYMNEIDTLNRSLQIHQSVLESQGYKASQQEKIARQKVCDDAANVFGITFVLQEELKEYFDKKAYDTEKIKKFQERMKLIREKTLTESSQ